MLNQNSRKHQFKNGINQIAFAKSHRLVSIIEIQEREEIKKETSFYVCILNRCLFLRGSTKTEYICLHIVFTI